MKKLIFQSIVVCCACLFSFTLLNAQSLKTAYSFEQISSPNSIQKLDLSNLNLSSIPETIGAFTNLQELDLSNNQLNSLPAAIRNLKALKVLKINNNPNLDFFQLIEMINELPLESLALNQCNIPAIPANIRSLKQLKNLSLSQNNIQELPSSFHELVALQNLNLGKNNLQNIDELIKIKSITSLDLSENHSVDWAGFFMGLKAHPNLKTLTLHGLKQFPTELMFLSNINSLDLSYGTFYLIPLKIKGWKNLHTLKLNHCVELNYDDTFLKLSPVKKLNTLEVYHDKFSRLPKGIALLKNLETLKTGGAKLKVLSNDLWKCKKLHTLIVDHSPRFDFEKNVATLKLLPALKELTLRRIGLQKITNAFVDMRLTYLDLRGNFLSKENIQTTKNTLPDLTLLADPIDKTTTGNQHINLEDPSFDKKTISSFQAETVTLTSGNAIRIPAQAFQTRSTGNIDLFVKEYQHPIEIMLRGIPLEIDSSNQTHYIKKAGMVEWFAQQNGQAIALKPNQSIELEWNSDYQYHRMNSFLWNKKTSTWTPYQQDELVYQPNQNTVENTTTDLSQIEMPTPPKAPGKLLQESIRVHKLDTKDPIFKVKGAIKQADKDAGNIPDWLKKYNELSLMKGITWRYLGAYENEAHDLIQGLDELSQNTPATWDYVEEKTNPSGRITDLIIRPNHELDCYTLIFNWDLDSLKINAYPLFNGVDLSLKDPISDQEKNADFYTNYLRMLNQRNLEWSKLSSELEYTEKNYAQQMSVYKKKMEEVSALVAPSGIQPQVNDQANRKIKLSEQGIVCIGKTISSIGDEFKIRFVDQKTNNDLSPIRFYIADETNDLLLSFNQSSAQIDVRAKNSIVALFPQNQIGIIPSSQFRKLPKNTEDGLLTIDMEVFPLSALNTTRLNSLLGLN